MKIKTDLRSGEQNPAAQLFALMQSNNIDTAQMASLLQDLDPDQVQTLMAQLDPEQRMLLVQFFITPQLASTYKSSSFSQSA